MDQYYFKTPFASGGDTTAIPAATQPSGDVSMTQGFTYDYERDLATDPAAKAIPRAQDNWLYNVITDALRQYQQVGIPEWITSADNGGSPFAYAQGVLVVKSGVIYQSLVASNTGTPGVDTDKWGVFPLLNAIAAVTADRWSTPRSLSLTGDVTAALTGVDGSANKSAAATIANGAVTNAKLAAAPANTVKANASSSAGAPADLAIGVSQLVGRGATGDIAPISLGNGLSMSGQTLNVTGVPTGAVFWFAAVSTPAGYLECNGATVSRTTYAALFAIIGTTFGTGDGSTTFNLPDLRAEFIRGWDHGRGVDTGRTFGSNQADAFKSHTHTIDAGGGSSGPQSYISVDTNYNAAKTQTTNATGDTETRPVNVALLPCIKY